MGTCAEEEVGVSWSFFTNHEFNRPCKIDALSARGAKKALP